MHFSRFNVVIIENTICENVKISSNERRKIRYIYIYIFNPVFYDFAYLFYIERVIQRIFFTGSRPINIT